MRIRIRRYLKPSWRLTFAELPPVNTGTQLRTDYHILYYEIEYNKIVSFAYTQGTKKQKHNRKPLNRTLSTASPFNIQKREKKLQS